MDWTKKSFQLNNNDTSTERAFDPKNVGYALANRTDGLGERLCAVFNAMFIAELTGFEFKFTWERFNSEMTYHSVFGEKKIFSEEFIEKYFINETNKRSVSFKNDIQSLSALKADCTKRIEQGNLIASQNDFISKIKGSKEELEAIRAKVLSKLTFSENIEEIRDYVSRLEIDPNLIAIHIRAGDLVYGKFAERRAYIGKVLPAPLISSVIKSNVLGAPYILFGQEAEYARSMHNLGYAIDANTLRPGKYSSPLSRSMFDIFLMARCQRILTGSSGFSRFSKFIGSASTINIKEIFQPQEIANNIYSEITADEDLYSPLQVAYSAYFAHEHSTRDGHNLAPIELLKIATKFSPGNVLYRFLLIIAHYRVGQYSYGDDLAQIWEKELECDFSDFLKERKTMAILGTKTISGSKISAFNNDISSLQAAAENGSKYAKLMLSAIP